MVALIVLVSVLDGRAGSKIVWALAREYLRKKKKARDAASADYKVFHTALSRLSADGLVVRESRGVWKVTERGKKMFDGFMHRQEAEKRTAEKQKEKADTVVVFDIPEDDRQKRTRLRLELVALGFRLLQKSVWVGPGPVPAAFVKMLRDMRILPHVHIFSIAKKGTISDAV